MSSLSRTLLPAGKKLTARLGTDDWMMRGFIALIATYLIVALALPLYAILSKSFSTYHVDLTQFELQVSDENGTFDSDIVSAHELNEITQAYSDSDLSTSSDGRLAVTRFFPDFSFRSPIKYRIRGIDERAVFLLGSERKNGTGLVGS